MTTATSQEVHETEIWCLGCKAKTVTHNPTPTTMKNGRAAVQGTCATCGAKKFRIGNKMPRQQES